MGRLAVCQTFFIKAIYYQTSGILELPSQRQLDFKTDIFFGSGTKVLIIIIMQTLTNSRLYTTIPVWHSEGEQVTFQQQVRPVQVAIVVKSVMFFSQINNLSVVSDQVLVNVKVLAHPQVFIGFTMSNVRLRINIDTVVTFPGIFLLRRVTSKIHLN